MSPVRRSVPLALAALIHLSACISPATSVEIIVDSDLPRVGPWTLTATVREGASLIAATTTPDHRLTIGRDALGPHSFTIVPTASQPRNGEVSALVTLSHENVTLRRNLSFQFTAATRAQLRIFLPAGCTRAAPETECARIGRALCTQQELCEGTGRTCGDLGECVAVNATPTMPGRDAASTIDATRADAARDVSTPPPPPPPCGARGQPCCAMGPACAADAVCDGGTCAPCGAELQRCCANNGCAAAGASCTNGTCQIPCGAPGQRCCATLFCNEGAVCRAPLCQACGGVDQPCCNNRMCNLGTTCLDDAGGSFCRCGRRDSPCCNSTQCGADLFCVATGFGPICACGDRNQPCCTGRVCDRGGASCLDTGFGPICQCGNRNTPCCSGTMCEANLVCNSTGFGPICQCGIRNTPCCNGTMCEAGLRCNATGFGPICQ